jgi:hypothetical protein
MAYDDNDDDDDDDDDDTGVGTRYDIPAYK